MLIDDIKKRELNLFEALAIGRLIHLKKSKDIFNLVVIVGLPMYCLIVKLYEMAERLMGTVTYEMLTDPSRLMALMENESFRLGSIYYGLASFVQLIFLPIITMSLVKIAYNYLTETEESILTVIMSVLSKATVIIPSSIIVGFAVSSRSRIALNPLDIMAYVSMFFYTYLIFYECAVMIENKGVFSSLKYSISMAKGHFLKTLTFAFLISFFEASIVLLVSVGISFISTSAIVLVLANVLVLYITSVFNLSIVAYYISRKVVKERELQSASNSWYQ